MVSTDFLRSFLNELFKIYFKLLFQVIRHELAIQDLICKIKLFSLFELIADFKCKNCKSYISYKQSDVKALTYENYKLIHVKIK